LAFTHLALIEAVSLLIASEGSPASRVVATTVQRLPSADSEPVMMSPERVRRS
jgi:hypothetical protein